jgi:hypothetical protein
LEQRDAAHVSIVERMQRIDRRYIFLLMAAAVIVPTLWGLQLPVGKTSPTVEMLHEKIESLPEGSVVMLAYDFGPSAAPELYPMGTALLRHCFGRNIKVLGVALNFTGAPLCEMAMDETGKELGKTAGEDYVNLGWQPGVLPVLMGMATDIPGTFKEDHSGTKMSDLPLMSRARSYDDVALVVDLASSSSPDTWIALVGARFEQEVAAGVTAVMGADYYPYIQSGQLVGLLGGLKGAAEYETLIEQSGKGTTRMTAQSFAHALIVLFVLMGNAAYAITRARSRRGE